MDEEKKKKLDEAFSILDQFLEKTKCVAGDEYTLADIAVAVSVSTAEVALPLCRKILNIVSYLAILYFHAVLK